MSNRDGRDAKPKASHRFKKLKTGDPCPICRDRSKAKGRSKIKLDKDGHAPHKTVKSNSRLEHCDCGCKKKGSNNLFCSTCKWSNF